MGTLGANSMPCGRRVRCAMVLPDRRLRNRTVTHATQWLSTVWTAVRSAFSSSGRADLTLREGDVAPNFELAGSDGLVHSLDKLQQRWVVLAWFPKAFTGG